MEDISRMARRGGETADFPLCALWSSRCLKSKDFVDCGAQSAGNSKKFVRDTSALRSSICGNVWDLRIMELTMLEKILGLFCGDCGILVSGNSGEIVPHGAEDAGKFQEICGISKILRGLRSTICWRLLGCCISEALLYNLGFLSRFMADFSVFDRFLKKHVLE